MTQAPFSEISLGNLQVILRDVFWLLPRFSYLKHCPTLSNSLKHCPTQQLPALTGAGGSGDTEAEDSSGSQQIYLWFHSKSF